MLAQLLSVSNQLLAIVNLISVLKQVLLVLNDAFVQFTLVLKHAEVVRIVKASSNLRFVFELQRPVLDLQRQLASLAQLTFLPRNATVSSNLHSFRLIESASELQGQLSMLQG